MTDRKMKAAKAAFDTSVDCGITFFDTAEVYGSRVGKWFGFNCFLKLVAFAVHDVLKFLFYLLLLQMSFGAISSETLLGRYFLLAIAT